MRALVLGPGHPFRGGIAQTTAGLVAALAARGHELRFLTPRRQYPAWMYPGRSDRDAAACPPLEGSEALLDPLWPPLWLQARRRALEARADVWLIPWWTWVWAPMWWFMLREPAARRPPAVAIVHNPADHDGSTLHRVAASVVLTRCQALFTHSERLARDLGSTFPGVPVAFHPLPAPAPAALPERRVARSRLAVGDHDRLAVFLGLIRPYKGVDVLIDAMAMLPGECPWRLLVAGEPWGALGRKLRDQVARRGVEHRVVLDLRWVPQGEIPALLAAADAVVLPYRAGSQSAVVPLALAHGLPVVTTAVGGLPEVVQHGVNGLVVEAGSPRALATALQSLNGERLEALAEGARATAGGLTWDGYAGALEDLVGRVPADPGSLEIGRG